MSNNNDDSTQENISNASVIPPPPPPVEYDEDRPSCNLDLLKKYNKLPFKVVPLIKDSSKPAVNGLREIYENPSYWTDKKLETDFYLFKNIATLCGPVMIDGEIYYLHCFDCDSEKAYSQIYELVQEYKLTTFVTKTQKQYGFHLY